MQNEERINGLENQVRTLKRIVYGFGCLLVAGVVVSATSMQKVPSVIQAKKFEVVNEKGIVVSSMHYDYAGGMFELMDDTGIKSFLTLECLDDAGGLLRTNNGDGQELVRLGVSKGGVGSVVIENGKGQSLVELGATTTGQGMVVTMNRKGQPVVHLSATVEGEGAVTTQSGKGQTLVALGATLDGGMVVINNGKGQELVTFGVTAGGNGSVKTRTTKVTHLWYSVATQVRKEDMLRHLRILVCQLLRFPNPKPSS